MSQIKQEAQRVLQIEAEGILNLSRSLDDNFIKAVDLIRNCTGKVIVTGMGKSGQVGRKISSTLSSTGTPSFFLSPAESSHGDLGVIANTDLVLAISYGGEVEEMQLLLKFVSRKGLSLISMTGNSESTLALTSTINLNIKVEEEACPLGLAPTTSSTVTLALGDALAMGVLKSRGFKKEDFAEYHPGGKLGRQLLTKVVDVMHPYQEMAIVNEEMDMSEVIVLMTAKSVRGVAAVVNNNDELVGVITDGNIRRRLERSKDILYEKAKDLMTKHPKTIDSNEMAMKALFLMEQFEIQSLIITDQSSDKPRHPNGIIHFQDLLKAKIR